MSNPNIESVASANAKKSTQLPRSIQFAIMTVLPNIPNGAFWGFSTMQEIQPFKDDLRKDNLIMAHKVSGGCLIEVEPNYLCDSISAVDSSLLNANDIRGITQGSMAGYLELKKFLIKKGKHNFQGKIGIYCTNDVTTISYSGTNFPAFRVNSSTFFALCREVGYVINVNGKWIAPAEILSNPELTRSFWNNSCVLSPTNTGIFVEIACIAKKDKLDAMEKELKASSAKR